MLFLLSLLLAALQNWKTLLGGSFVTVLGVLSDIDFAKNSRLRLLLSKPIEKFKLGIGMPLILKKELANEIRLSIFDGSCGVKILWIPQGGGKSTTVREVVSNLQLENAIAGALIISPPDNNNILPSEWFRQALVDMRGPLLGDHEKLSKRLPAIRNGKLFVFVLDQLENCQLNEDLKCFIKTLAEDSDRVKSYVIIAITSDAVMATTMWEWNGRQKITLMGDDGLDFSTYKWSEVEVKEWLQKYQPKYNAVEKLLAEDSELFESLSSSAVSAGTPGFLAFNVPKETSDIKKVDQKGRWSEKAKYYSDQWKSGLDLIRKERNRTNFPA